MTFRWRRGQPHYSGWYWSAVMGGHVGYESRLELAWLLLADRDRRLRRIVEQPFRLVARVDGAERRHVPDVVAVREDGLVMVVDVKPRRRRPVRRQHRRRLRQCARRDHGGGRDLTGQRQWPSSERPTNDRAG
ncbi:TnsA-like heteromeric transposase endonuclease subunit [Pseudofrankia asymbiotica]|uniref:TnsA-like heteromeric transposase endonuclease subunit n=1 Tax=Pseudofrankia asymbiotica TaxID=1834516 RepID=UPI003B75C250